MKRNIWQIAESLLPTNEFKSKEEIQKQYTELFDALNSFEDRVYAYLESKGIDTDDDDQKIDLSSTIQSARQAFYDFEEELKNFP